MAFFKPILVSLLYLTTLAASFPRPFKSKSAFQTIHQFPNETWIENIAVRSNGLLLVTLITTPELYQVDPFSKTTPQLIHRFPNATSVLGITEIEPDVFGVIVGNWSTETFESTNGSYSVWRVDLRPSSCAKKTVTTSNAIVSKITSMPEAYFLNGLELLSPSSPFLLIADSGMGVVWRLNHITGEYGVVLDDALMKPVADEVVLGINALHTRNGFLYFTNTFQRLFARVRISPCGTATGPYEVVAYNGLGDDFTFDKHGNAFVAQDAGNALQLVTPDGTVTVLAGNVNSTILVGDTSAAFGRTEWDRDTLYVVTNGGMAGAVPGHEIVGGKVIRVDVTSLLAHE